jgi:hypothetical protein
MNGKDRRMMVESLRETLFFSRQAAKDAKKI